MRARRTAPDAGFTLIELTVVVVIVATLAAIAVPVFMGQRVRAIDATVMSDLKSLAQGAENYFAREQRYPGAAADFAWGATVSTTRGNEFVAFSDQVTGYVVFGKGAGSTTVFVLSSYEGSGPRSTDLVGLPVTGPGAGQFGPAQPDLGSTTAIPVP